MGLVRGSTERWTTSQSSRLVSASYTHGTHIRHSHHGCTALPWHLLSAVTEMQGSITYSTIVCCSPPQPFSICSNLGRGKHMATPSAHTPNTPVSETTWWTLEKTVSLMSFHRCFGPNDMTSDAKEPHQNGRSGQPLFMLFSCLSGSGPVARSIVAVRRIMYSARMSLQLADSAARFVH